MFYGTFQNCTSLLSGAGFGDFTVADVEAFRETYRNCTSLTSTPVLSCQPNNTASFYQAFQNCTSLRESNWSISAIGVSALYGAFQNCSSLTSAPAVSAESVPAYGMAFAYSGCTSLSAAPALPATTLAQQCY